MPQRYEDDPSRTGEPARSLGVRRAVLGGVTGAALMFGPVGLAKAVVPDGGPDIQVGDGDNLFAAIDRDAGTALEYTEIRVNQALAAQEPTIAEKASVPTTNTTTTTTTTTTTVPPEGDHPPDTGGGFGNPGDHGTWDALAQCESGGNWSINTGNGYYGGLQFSHSTWQSVGGSGYAHENSREEQIYRGQILQERAGWGQWPSCARRLGLI